MYYKIERLKEIPLFKTFDEKQLNNLLASEGVMIKEYQKNQVIHLQNDSCSSLGIILSGHVTIEKIDEDGNLLIITDFKSHDVFGANLLFSKRPRYPMTVSTKEPSLILHIDKEIIIDLCQNHQHFMIGFFQILSDRTLILSDKIHELNAKTIREKIIDFISSEMNHQKSNVIQLPLSKTKLAETFGVQRSSLSRELKKMKEEGLLDFDSVSITWKHM